MLSDLFFKHLKPAVCNKKTITSYKIVITNDVAAPQRTFLNGFFIVEDLLC